MVQLLAEDGFEFLDLGFGSLNIVSLDQGVFKLSDGTVLGEEFYCRMQRNCKKYLFKTALPDNDPRSALFYSYDGVTDINGAQISDKLEAWARQGISYETKTYMEVLAILTNQDTVLLSIPPSSVRRVSGKIVNLKGRGLVVKDTWMRVYKGAKVTNVVKPFIPWEVEPYNG